MLVQKSSGRDHFSHVADVRGSRSTTLAPSGMCQDKCQPLRSPRLSRFQTGLPRKLRSSAAEVMGKVWFPDQRKPLFPGEWDSSKENTLMWVRFIKKEIVPTLYHLCSEVLQHQWVWWIIQVTFRFHLRVRQPWWMCAVCSLCTITHHFV